MGMEKTPGFPSLIRRSDHKNAKRNFTIRPKSCNPPFFSGEPGSGPAGWPADPQFFVNYNFSVEL